MVTDDTSAESEETTSGLRMPRTITNYRDWIMAGSRGARVGLLIVALSLILFTGLAINVLRPVVGRGITFVVAWTVLLFVLYTLYAVVRSVVPGYNDPGAD